MLCLPYWLLLLLFLVSAWHFGSRSRWLFEPFECLPCWLLLLLFLVSA
jgi:hypothetical protein